MKCFRCGYDWTGRKERPKACPRCKQRLDYPLKSLRPFHDLESVIERSKALERGFERTLYVVSAITRELGGEGIGVVVIGGSAVEFYTRNWYATGDISLAIDQALEEEIQRVLEKAGFERMDRMWAREDLDLYIEMPGDIDEIDLQKVTKVETEIGYAYVVGIEDIIFDRIQAAKHWKSTGDEEQAIRLGVAYYEDIEWEYLRKKCRRGNSLDLLKKLLKRVEHERSEIE